MVPNGFEAAFVRVYYKDQELSAQVEDFSYTYDEEDDDEMELEFHLPDATHLDLPQYQEGAELRATWGFINSNASKTRRVWIRYIHPILSKNDIMIKIICTEKGTELKGSTEKTVHKNKSLIGAAVDKANKHGMKATLEVPDTGVKYNLTPLPGEGLSEYLVRYSHTPFQDFPKKVPHEVLEKQVRYYNNYYNSKDNTSIAKPVSKYQQDDVRDPEAPPPFRPNNRGGILPDIADFKIYKNSPQANKSDKQYLDDLAARENHGYVVETRDDELIIKKRNFTQKPYRTYEYGGTSGELICFEPEYNQRKRRGSSNNLGFTGWNPLNKNFFSGSATGDNDPVLNKWLEKGKYQYYKNLQKQGLGKLVDGSKVIQSQPYVPRLKGAPGFYQDPNKRNSESTHQGPSVSSPHVVTITVDDKVAALEKAKKDYEDAKEQKKKEFYNALGFNPEAAFNTANNLLKKGNLNKNPATATMWGDPSLTTGIIITILGAGKKNSGNYYVRKAIHKINRTNGYTVDVDMARQGSNKKGSDPNQRSATEEGMPINNRAGKHQSGSNTKSIKVKANGKKN